MKQRRAVTLAFSSGGIEGLLNGAITAEEAGYDDVWFVDTGFPDAMTLASVVAQQTKRIRIGIAITPVFTRTPVVLASSAATISTLATERFILGLGTSSHAIIEDWHGLKFERPLMRIRETTALLRQILSGQRSDFEGETIQSKGYRQPAAKVPLFLAALRPKMLETAAEIGDGVVLNLFPSSALPRIIEHIDRGRKKNERDQVEVVSRYMVAITESEEETRAKIGIFRQFMSSYFATPVYNQYLAWCGYPEAAAEIKAGWKAGDRIRTSAALSDELLREIAIIGDAKYCRDRIAENGKQGIDTHIITYLSLDPKVQKKTFEIFSKPLEEN